MRLLLILVITVLFFSTPVQAVPYPTPNYVKGESTKLLLETENENISEINKPCDAGNENRNSDLCAQWKAADAATMSTFWSELSFYANVIGGISIILTLIYTKKGWSAAIDANKIAQSMGRPWIGFDGIQTIRFSGRIDKNGDGNFTEVKNGIGFSLKLINQGQRPAIKVACYMFCRTSFDVGIPTLQPPNFESIEKFFLGANKQVTSVSHYFYDKELEDVLSRRCNIYLFGHVIYSDPSGGDYSTQVCYKCEYLGNVDGVPQFIPQPIGPHNSLK